jgi:hypothetical protein
MEPVRKTTLQSIVREFPVVPWNDDELEELVAPRYGVITGFSALLSEIDALVSMDLGTIGPAPLRPRPSRR